MRFNLALACIAAVLWFSRPASAQQPAVGPGYDIDMSHMIKVRDGVELEAWVTKPSRLAGKVPTVLTLTQYDIDGGTSRRLRRVLCRPRLCLRAGLRPRPRQIGRREER